MPTLPYRDLTLAAIAAAAFAILPASQSCAVARLHGQGLLWRIDGLGYPPSHIFGTVHVSDERVLRLPQPVLDAFDASRACMFELIVPPDAFVGLPEQMLLPNGVTLDQLLGPDVYGKVAVAARRYGFTTRQIGRMRPSALMFAFGQPASEWQRRVQGWAFLDHALQNEARALGKPIYALETVQEQLAVLDAGGRGYGPAMLEALIEDSRLMELEYETMIQNYLRADMDAIYSQEASRASSLPYETQQALAAYRELLLDRRNQVMVERMQPQLALGRAFIAIGAAHLAGKQGVLNLLESKGYRITRVY